MFDFKFIHSYLKREHNFDISPFSITFLNKAFTGRMEVRKCKTFSDYLEILEADPNELNTLHESLRVKYTEFFRSSLIYAQLEQYIIPNILILKEMAGSTQIRIWSAGCSSGQEAYSLAIILSELINTRTGRFNCRIFATDISEKDLEYAIKGEYSTESIENVKVKHLNRYFNKRGNDYCIDKSIRDLIQFSVYDLLENGSISPPQSIFGNFDIVMCCNVLLYYNPEVQKKIIEKFDLSLTDQGYLIVGDDETSLLRLSNRFVSTVSGSSIHNRR